MPKTSTVDYYLEGFEDYTHDRLCEETAWGIVELYGWTPTPQLIMWLTKLAGETVGQADSA